MAEAQYIYGCSVLDSTFGAALGRAVKIDSLVKVDVLALIARGKETNQFPITGCVDTRTVTEVLASNDPNDPVKIFKLPAGFYAQESRFVPRVNDKAEGDSWLLSFIFDEVQLDEHGVARPNAKSELCVIDARDMKTVVCKIQLPQRVPYGLHGAWFSEEDIKIQRPVESIRPLPLPKEYKNSGNNLRPDVESVWMHSWMRVRNWLLENVG